MKGVKQINIQIITKDDDFTISFLSKKKIVSILGDKKTSVSSFFKALLKL